MKQSKNKSQQTNKISIVKNKEIIIYQNGEEFKRFKQSETKDLNEDEMYILDFLLKKYSLYEVAPKNSKLDYTDFEFESADDFFNKKKGKSSQTPNNLFESEEERKTEPKLKEFFKDIEVDEENGEEGYEGGKEEIIETKKYKKGIRTTEDVKVPIQKKNQKQIQNQNKIANYNYEEENIDIEEENQEEEEESEESPQYIIELESYTSPSIKNIDQKRSEEEILNGIKTSMMVNGQEKKGIIFLGESESIIFASFDEDKENSISLNNIKRIYFNVRGSINLRNYKKKQSERFIQFVELNNKKTDFKFNNDRELNYFVMGIIQTFKNKTPPLDKNKIYKSMKKYFTYSTDKTDKKEINTYSNSFKNIYTNRYSQDKNYNNEIKKTSYYNKRNARSNEYSNNANTNTNINKYEDKNNENSYKKRYGRNNFYYESNKKYGNYDYNLENLDNIDNNDAHFEENENNQNNENYEEYENNQIDENYEEKENNENYEENENKEENNEEINENYEKEEKEENYENEENNQINEIEEKVENFEKEENNENEDNYENDENNNNDNDDGDTDGDFITTTKTEIFKNGKLINEETKERYRGVTRTLHSYSPDVREYEEYLRRSTKSKSYLSGNDDLNRNIRRIEPSSRTYKSNRK